MKFFRGGILAKSYVYSCSDAANIFTKKIKMNINKFTIYKEKQVKFTNIKKPLDILHISKYN